MKAIPRKVREEIKEVVESELKKSRDIDTKVIMDILDEKYNRRFCSPRVLEMLIGQVCDEIVYVDVEESEEVQYGSLIAINNYINTNI